MKTAGNIIHFNNNLTKDSNNSKLPYEAAKNGLKKYENSTLQLNGILKNGTSKLNGTTNGQPKNISFGEVKQ